MSRRDDPLFSRCFDYSPPEGWDPIVDRCIGDIRTMLHDAGVLPGVFSIRQIKEKFGGLRIYVDGLPVPPSPLGLDAWRMMGESEEDREPPTSFYLKRLGSVDFDKEVPVEMRERVLAAIVSVAYVPDALGQRILDRIKAAAREADQTCQRCGQPGTFVITKGWHATLCRAHRPQ